MGSAMAHRSTVHRIVILGPADDGRAAPLARHLPDGARIRVADVYTTARAPADGFAQALCNPVTQSVMETPPAHDWAVEVGFLPGVTDNVGTSAAEMLAALGAAQPVHSAQLYLLTGADEAQAQAFAGAVANPLINRVSVAADYGEIAPALPTVNLHSAEDGLDAVELDIPDEALRELSARGVRGRGPLGLSLTYMHAIRDHFRALGRAPRGIELEMLAQSWSEHCKHTIFASPIDEIEDGLYKHYIKGTTAEIRAEKGEKDFCVSVFTDNAGGIVFDENWVICDKVETHNSPSALDPFGGAVTGIVGVNRDVLGFGMGAKPVINRYGFCFAPPGARADYTRDPAGKTPILGPEAIMEGVVHGVEHGGNCSGIPTPQGFTYFDDRFIGKPLVFVGTVGLIPREVTGRPSHEKAARPGDVIIMAGGRVGADGIHGATFSSIALDEGAPATAVQIGDPITQKKMSDALMEVRDRGWWSAITDNGAGGLSSSVGEMAQGPGGFEVALDAVPLKYPGLEPWQIWVSESQERMTLAASAGNADKIIAHLASRGVEATVIGRFTDTGRAVVRWKGAEILDLSMEFLHDGIPTTPLTTTFTIGGEDEPAFPPLAQEEAAPALPPREEGGARRGSPAAGIIVRQLRPEEWEAYRDMRLEALKAHPDLYLATYDQAAAEPDSHWQTRISDPDGPIFGLFEGRALIGIGGIWQRQGCSPTLCQGYIQSAHRGRGLSRLLYRARVDWARAAGLAFLLAGHQADNAPSRRAMERAGFVFTHQTEEARGDGAPTTTRYYRLCLRPNVAAPKTYGDAVLALLARPNVASREAIATRFDHGVQGGVQLGPLQGPGRVCADATVTRPLLGNPRGVVLSQGIFPRYGDIDTGAMAAASLDFAVRAAVAAGADPDHLALLDNFCWCSSDEPARLGQLKRAAAALHDAALAYGTPFISGKDSMFNDFRGYDSAGRPVTISAPPTTLVSAIGVIADAARAVDIAPKAAGDRLYLLGATRDERGGGEYYAMRGALGRTVPATELASCARLYRAYGRAARKGLVASAMPLGLGGLAAALGKTAVAGGRGLEVDLSAIDLTAETALFSESTGRILVTVAPDHVKAFEKALKPFARPLGHVAESDALHIRDTVTLTLAALTAAYRTL